MYEVLYIQILYTFCTVNKFKQTKRVRRALHNNSPLSRSETCRDRKIKLVTCLWRQLKSGKKILKKLTEQLSIEKKEEKVHMDKVVPVWLAGNGSLVTKTPHWLLRHSSPGAFWPVDKHGVRNNTIVTVVSGGKRCCLVCFCKLSHTITWRKKRVQHKHGHTSKCVSMAIAIQMHRCLKMTCFKIGHKPVGRVGWKEWLSELMPRRKDECWTRMSKWLPGKLRRSFRIPYSGQVLTFPRLVFRRSVIVFPETKKTK